VRIYHASSNGEVANANGQSKTGNGRRRTVLLSLTQAGGQHLRPRGCGRASWYPDWTAPGRASAHPSWTTESVSF